MMTDRIRCAAKTAKTQCVKPVQGLDLNNSGTMRAQRPDGQRDVGRATEPAIGGVALQINVVFVLGEIVAELQRAEAERILHHQLKSVVVARKPAETGAVIVLDEARALLEHFGNRVDGKRRQEQCENAEDCRQSRAAEGGPGAGCCCSVTSARK